MKKIISLLLIVLFAVTTYSTQASADEFPKGRTAAVGDEPNGDGQAVEEANQSGVTVLGAGASQVKTCTNCQKAGNVLLSSSTRRASPGIIQQTGAGGTGTPSNNNGVDTGN